MPLLEWSDDFSVHVAEIDGQHRRLVAILNELYEAMKTGQPEEQLEQLIGQLAQYAGEHFATEEKYMLQTGYTGYTAHCNEHTAFTAQVTDFITGLNGGRFSLSMEIATYVRDWIRTHVMGTDQQYSAWFNQHGIA
jgi:hemerythrin